MNNRSTIETTSIIFEIVDKAKPLWLKSTLKQIIYIVAVCKVIFTAFKCDTFGLNPTKGNMK